jgi:hypothetical protein
MSRARPAGPPPVDRASLRPPFAWEMGRINLDMVCFRAQSGARRAPTAKPLHFSTTPPGKADCGQINTAARPQMAKNVDRAYIGCMRADPIIVQRWRDLRQMLIRQLDMFDSGNISLKADSVDISADAIRNLKREIFDFDALISDDEAKQAAGR